MSLRGCIPILGTVCLTLGPALSDAAAQPADYHHVHLSAPNPLEAAAWYMEHMGCEIASASLF